MAYQVARLRQQDSGADGRAQIGKSVLTLLGPLSEAAFVRDAVGLDHGAFRELLTVPHAGVACLVHDHRDASLFSFM